MPANGIVNSHKNCTNTLPELGYNKNIIRILVQTLKNKLFKSKLSFHTQKWHRIESRQSSHKFQNDSESICPRNSQHSTRQPVSAQNTISELPPELVLMIASKLPMSFAVAWSLSSKYFYNVLGRIYIPEINRKAPSLDILLYQARILPKPLLNTNSRERQKLLSLLDRDDTKLIFCYFCQILHKPLFTLAHLDQTLTQYPCTHAIYGTQSCNIIFNISQVRMAMKLYHQGIDPSKHLRALTQSTRSLCSDISTTRILPRIIKNKLFVRVVHTYRVPNDSANITWYDGASLAQSKLPSWVVSCHLSRCPESGIILETRTIVRRAQDKSRSMLQTSLRQCPQCKTDYEIRVPIITSHHAIVECISWHDLGEGDMPFWSPQLMSQMKRLTDIDTKSRLGSNKYAFERY